jgi:hypothetical protein
MSILLKIIITLAGLFIAFVGWSLVRINHPRAPEEEREQWEQDLKDFDADMARRGKKQ